MGNLNLVVNNTASSDIWTLVLDAHLILLRHVFYASPFICLLKAFVTFHQAIVNEDASGDVIAMRIQIQQLKVPFLITEFSPFILRC